MTCRDCIHYYVCETKNEKVSLGTKVEELVADNFTCFENKADFVKVCRCGKCKWYIDSRMQCGHPFVLFSDRLMTTQFCSYGERKENE